jgi:predicted Zn-dependent protease
MRLLYSLVLLFTYICIQSSSAHRTHQAPFDLRQLRPDVIQNVQTELAQFGSHVPTKDPKMIEANRIIQDLMDEMLDRPANRHLTQGYKFSVSIYESTDFNASALPDGRIQISSQAIRMLHTSENIAAVLAHEVGHVVRGHTYRLHNRACIFDLGKRYAGIGGTIAISGVEFFELKRLSRTFEHEADHVALELLHNTDVNPQALTQVLKKLQAIEFALSPYPTIPGMPRSVRGWMFDKVVRTCSTHPATCDRMQSIQKELSEHRYKTSVNSSPRLARYSGELADLLRLIPRR